MPAGDARPPAAVIRQAMDAFLAHHPLPGLAVGLVDSRGAEAIVTSGFADVEAGIRLDERSVFRIASMSKVLTAVAVMRLCETEKIGLDDPVNRHLAEFRVMPPRFGHPHVTVRHLLAHTSGIAAWGNARSAADLGETRPDSVCELYGRVLVAATRPGAAVTYSNHNYAVLGQLVEDVTGRPVEEYVTDEVLVPLGMRDTGYRPGDRDVRGYGRDATGAFRSTVAPGTRLVAACEARSSVADLVRLATALLPGRPGTALLPGRSGTVLGEESRRLMLAPHFRLHPNLSGRGLCFAVRALAGQPLAHVDSFNAMYSGTIQLLPERGTAVVVLANLPALHAIDVLADVILRLAEDLPSPAVELTGGAAAEHEPDREHWRTLEGSYTPLTAYDPANERDPMAQRGAYLRVRSAADGLTLQVEAPGAGERPQFPLVPANNGDPMVFQIPATHLEFSEGQSPCTVVFRTDRRGRVNGLVVLSFLIFRRGRPAGRLQRLIRRTTALPGHVLDRITAMTWRIVLAGRRGRGRRYRPDSVDSP